jgi:hypothetical protein
MDIIENQTVAQSVSLDIIKKINDQLDFKYTKIDKVDDEYHIYGNRLLQLGNGKTNITYVYKKCLHKRCTKFVIYDLDRIGNIHGECPHCGPVAGISRTIDRIMQ